MVNRVIQHGKDEAHSALGNTEEIRVTLAEVANLDDFLEDLDAAERTLRLYSSTCFPLSSRGGMRRPGCGTV